MKQFLVALLAAAAAAWGAAMWLHSRAVRYIRLF